MVKTQKPKKENNSKLYNQVIDKKKKPKKVQKSKTGKNMRTDIKKILRVGVLVTAGLLLAVLLVGVSFAGAAYAYQNEFEGKALFGTKILGQDLSGLTYDEMQAKIKESLNTINFKFSVDGTELMAKPADVGITYRLTETTDNAFYRGRNDNYYKNILYSAISLAYKVNSRTGAYLASHTHYHIENNIDIVYRIDNAKLDAFAKKISDKFNAKSKDAGLVVKGTDIKVIPAVYGRAVATESIKNQIGRALLTGDSATIDIDVAEVRPDINEAEASASITAAEEILKSTVVYTYEGNKYIPTKERIGSWIIFKKNGKKLVPVIDSTKVRLYLNTIAKDINIPAVNQKVRVINGGKREITRKGRDGLAVDVNTAAARTATSLNAHQSINYTLRTYVVHYKTEFNNVLVANWDKYIEIDISSQRMCAYLSGGQRVNCWYVTTGADGWSTPTGTFVIYRKAGAGGIAGGPGGGGVCMPNPPYSTPLCGINWVSTFTPQGHAIHEAWWRSSFGTSAYHWNGSHGCINATYNIARFIYYWAPKGTPVVIHY